MALALLQDSSFMTQSLSYSFADTMDQWLTAQAGQLKKRDRTRIRLQIAGCRLLDQDSLSNLTISRICKQGEIAQGTFYLHFEDRQDFVTHLLHAFIGFLQVRMHQAGKDNEADSIRATTGAYYGLFEANLGLMKCLIHHLEDFPASREAFLTLNREWAQRVSISTMRRWERQGRGMVFPSEELERRAYSLGGLVDQYLTALLLHKDPHLAALSQDREAVIDSLSDIWKRGLAL